MKNKRFIIVILFSIFLVACQSNSNENNSTHVTFKGSTDIWSAELQMVNNQETKLILKYEGEDFIHPENLDFKLNSSKWGWGMGDINLDTEGIFVTEDIDADKISTSESDIIEVEVNWNDQVDTFTLKKE